MACNSSKSVFASKDMEVIKASKQTVHPGVEGAPSSVNYHFTVVLNSKKIGGFSGINVFDLKAKKAIKTSNLKVYKGNKIIGDQGLSKGDTVQLFTSYTLYHDIGLVYKQEAVGNPELAEALISYQVNGKDKQVGVKKVKEVETLYAP